MGLPTAAISSITWKHFSVESSPGYGPLLAAARQWRQESPHLRVTSQAIRRGAG
jgi:hypothetical protein